LQLFVFMVLFAVGFVFLGLGVGSALGSGLAGLIYSPSYAAWCCAERKSQSGPESQVDS